MVPLLQSQLFAARARIRAGRERVAATDSIARSMIKPSLTIYCARFQLMGKRESAAV